MYTRNKMANVHQKFSGITLIFFLFIVSCNEISAEIADRLSKETIATLGFGMSQDVPLKLHKRDLKSQVFSRSKRFRRDDASDAKCKEEKSTFQDALKSHKDGFLTNFTFVNETKTSLSIVWGMDSADKRIIIVVVAEEFLGMLAKPSSVYISDDDGGHFVNIDDRVKVNKAPAYIKKGNGVQKSPNSQKKIILVGHDQASTTALYITDDGGHKFNIYTAPFLLADAFVWHPKKDEWLLARAADSTNLYLSTDLGRTWKQISTNVVKFKWGVSNDDKEQTIFLTRDPSGKPVHSPTDIKFYPLFKTTNNGESWKIIKENAYTFGSEGKFLYASIQKKGTPRERLMEVSTDGGQTWNEAQLPTITHDRFYSILDMSEDMIFMHVDSPGDSGHGTLYSSDSTGIVFAESLDKHLYPNYQDVTDFYKVKSLRGVYLASQMADDKSIHTVITFNRGAEWKPVRRPSGAPCKDESKPCFLHIHNMYSLSRGIQSQPPLSTPEATGIIMVHGHVADALQTTPPDVYVSSNGGYDFIKSLDGPHHYQIADQGGLLVAVPSSTRTPQIIKFSTDEGRCWHEYKFTDKELIFTGLLTEPGNKAMHIGLWGFGVADRKWRVTIINFQNVISKPCSSGDYETWQAHSEMLHGSDPNDKGCLLGVKETFQRLKKDSWCFKGRDWKPQVSKETCTCTKDDYECDYGYWRPINKLECTRNKNVTQEVICLHGKEEKLITQGYRKIPGDICTDGFEPKADKQQDLFKKCSEGEKFINPESNAKAGASPKSGGSAGLVAGVVVIVLVLVLLMTGFFVRKCYLLRKTNVTYKYSMLHQNEEYDYDNDFENALSTSHSLYQDSEEEVMANFGLPPPHSQEVDNSSQSKLANGRPKIPRPVANGKPKVQSYHDDSDDDMLE
ncbi:sortilin-like isoform X2 [Lineus longissimus]|uniref:sortilin-like isoform X2 n=1 Tax=Lineus longissimus TaxID=88925 RepID=UPI00315D4A4F